ncbi:MAG: hypothetical protein ACRDYY_17555, partial [Acidimicrobiales bacterium]
MDLDDEIDGVWSEYKRTGDRRLRDQLIVRYSPLVKFVAGRVSAGLSVLAAIGWRPASLNQIMER